MDTYEGGRPSTAIIVAGIASVVVLIIIIIAFVSFRSSSNKSARPGIITKTLTGCESIPPLVACDAGDVIKSGTVKYGRWDNTVCPHPTVASSTVPLSGTYNFPSTVVGTSSYQFPALNTLFGDPYPNVFKQYDVSYTCGKK